jgi:glutamine synthetase
MIVVAEYIWIGGKGDDIRSKSRTLDFYPDNVCDLPIWNYDGSSTGQAPGSDSEVMLHPVAIFNDPFRKGEHILVMCEAILPNGKPANKNNRAYARNIFENKLVKNEQTWYGLEQEYTLFETDGKTPLGWPNNGFPGPQGPYYCSVGYGNAVGRHIMDEHYITCLDAGVKISGTNAEVMKGQWEYQIGPCEGLDCGDHMWISRYLLYRVCEYNNVVVSFDPKPIEGDWNGSGCHTNFSTLSMRNGVTNSIENAVYNLSQTHDEHIKVYGDGNDRRMTGLHETSNINDFSYGVANRGCSIRIPRDTAKNKRGYIEDRRPASNIDPYLVSAKIAETVLLNDFGEHTITLETDV